MHMYREDSFQKPEQTVNACQTIVFASAGPFLMERVFVVDGGVSHVIVYYELCRVWFGKLELDLLTDCMLQQRALTPKSM